MSAHAFVLVLTCGAALLALWIIARFVNFGPRSVAGALVHVAAAFLLLTFLLPLALAAIGASGVPAVAYVKLFGVALPLFVYAFLSGGWVARVAMGMLR